MIQGVETPLKGCLLEAPLQWREDPHFAMEALLLRGLSLLVPWVDVSVKNRAEFAGNNKFAYFDKSISYQST